MPDYLINSLAVCPDRNRIYPEMIKGKGVYLYDSNGKKYLDGVSGKAAVASIGHGNEDIADAVAAQLKQLAMVPTYAFQSPVLDNYLQKLIAYSPPGFSKAWLMTSGSEAIENACKLAYQYHSIRGEPARSKFISRHHSYHGNSIFGLDIGGIKYRKDVYKPLLKGYPQIPPAHGYRCSFGCMNNCTLQCAASLEQTIMEEGPGTIAAFIVEPVSGAALGASPAPDGYLQTIRQICSKYGVLMIVDEVMTGFGRTGYNFAVDHWNVIPDIIVAGKGIGSGYYPLSAIIAHKLVMEPFELQNIPFGSLYSYACNTIGACVGSRVIDFLIDNDINANVRKVGSYLLHLLGKLKKYPVVGDVRGMGLMIAIEFVEDQATKKPFRVEEGISALVSDLALENGLIVYPCKGGAEGPNGDHILLTPPLILQEHEATNMAALLDKTISQLMTRLQSHAQGVALS